MIWRLFERSIYKAALFEDSRLCSAPNQFDIENCSEAAQLFLINPHTSTDLTFLSQTIPSLTLSSHLPTDGLASGVQTIQFMFSLLVYTRSLASKPNTDERSHFSRVSRTTRSAGVIFPFPSDKKTPYLCSVQFHWIAQMVLNIN